MSRQRLENYFALKRGHDLPTQFRGAGDVPVISSSGITGFHSEAKVQGPGVVTGRYGTLGEVFYEERDYWPLNTTLYVYDFKGSDPKFVYYFLQALNFDHLNSAAAVPGLDRKVIHNLKVGFPRLEIQKNIVSVLSVYDELIDNNIHRIALLEEIAGEIYKEWFVRLRFPGYENANIDDGVPDGWEKVRISDAFDILGGGTPSTSENSFWQNGTINWFTPTDVTGAEGLFISNTNMKITESGLVGSSAKMFPPYSVLMTSRATIGAIAVNTEPASTNQGFITCLQNENFPYTYIVNWIKISSEIIDIYASGATFKEISKSVFKRLNIVKPSKEVVDRYHQQADPMYKTIKILLDKNEILKQTRDLLLPRLISGQLSVEHLLEAQ